MRHIAEIPRLRMLRAQGTVASDDGFAALAIRPRWNTYGAVKCPDLSGRGFTALSKMPSLRGLGISCKNVDDTSLATLPRFPALCELMPVDVTDAGFRHVGACELLNASDVCIVATPLMPPHGRPPREVVLRRPDQDHGPRPENPRRDGFARKDRVLRVQEQDWSGVHSCQK